MDPEEVGAAARRACADGADTIVVALIHAYVNPANERAVRDAIRAAAPDLAVTLSSDVWPVIREYERTVTATVAGYVQRRVAAYIGSLQDALRDAEVPAPPMITKSNGGIMAAELGKTDPVAMLLSGTASGVIGAADVAARVGASEVLSFDVGGTSADVAVIQDGKPAFGTGEMVGEFPIYVPTVSVTSIGAGGGSIARVDEFGVLKVGPESAGARPGPACYGGGGTLPTITDAFAVLNLLGAGNSATERSPSIAARPSGPSRPSPSPSGSPFPRRRRASSGSRSRGCTSRSRSSCRATGRTPARSPSSPSAGPGR